MNDDHTAHCENHSICMLSSFYFIYVNICLKHNESNSHIESVVIAYIEHLTKEENLHGNSYHVVDMNMVIVDMSVGMKFG